MADDFWKERVVLVSGARGFIGAHLVRALLAKGAIVHAIAREPLPELKGSDSVYWYAADIVDADRVRDIYLDAAPTVTFHAAAYGVQPDDRDLWEAVKVNVMGSHSMFSAAELLPNHRFLYLGTRYESERYLRPVTESDVLAPAGIYGVTKAAGQLLLERMVASDDISLRVAFLFGVYGPGEEKDKFIPHVITSLLNGVSPSLTGCEQIRDYTYIEDVVAALMALAAVDDEDAKRVNIGSGRAVSLREVVDEVATILESKARIEFGSLPYRDDEIWQLVPDTGRTKRLLQWEPRVSLHEGLQKTIDWYKAN